jgi:hypothetical protein
MMPTILMRATLALTLTVVAAGCGPSVARQYAAILAANTNQLNDQIAGMTAARRQIETTRARLTSMMELSTERNEQFVQGRMAEWKASADVGNVTASHRVKLFDAASAFNATASKKQEEIDALKRTVNELSIVAKGDRSAKLGETSAKLAILSQEASLKDKVKFLADFAKSVRDSIEESKKDAESAAESASSAATNLESGPSK